MNAERAYFFRHALLRDAAYQLQMPGDRAKLHGMAFELLEGVAGGRPPDPGVAEDDSGQALDPHPSNPWAGELAEHGEASRDESLRPATEMYLRRAALHAQERFLYEDAEQCWLRLGRRLSGADLARVLRKAAWSATRGGHASRAEPLLRRALELCGSDRAAAGIARWALAAAFDALGRIDRKREECALALADFRAAGRRRLEAEALCGLAGALPQDASPETVVATYDEALAVARDAGDRFSEGVALGNRSVFLHNCGRLEEAERGYEAALALHRKAGNRQFRAVALGSLAHLFCQTGRQAEGAKMFEEALAMARDVGERRLEGALLRTYAPVQNAAGRPGDAERGLVESLRILREVGDRRQVGQALESLGDLYRLTGRRDRTHAIYEEAMALHRETGNLVGLGTVTFSRAVVAMAESRHADAERLFAEAIQMHRKVGSVRMEAGTLCARAMLFVGIGRRDEAATGWRDGMALFEKLGDRHSIDLMKRRMAEACQKAGVPLLEDVTPAPDRSE